MAEGPDKAPEDQPDGAAAEPMRDAAVGRGPYPGAEHAALVSRRAPSALRHMFGLRRYPPRWQTLLFSAVFLGLMYLLWSLGTAGPAEERTINRNVLPSPTETFDSFEELWFERALTRNTYTTLRRVILGFLLACVIGIPLGVLCGCFGPVQAFLLPLTIFGRNIPLAALIPITFAAFGIGETQKVMFIFIACVMFIVGDTAHAVRDVSQRYVDTAYTLGASRRQVILKVLVPLSMPGVFNSLRLLFGLAFGYIMLAELVKLGSEAGGLGDIIRQSQRRGMQEHIWLVLFLIPILAFLIDKSLQWIQRELFPHRFGGTGILNRIVRWFIHRWEDLKGVMWQRRLQPTGPGRGLDAEPESPDAPADDASKEGEA